MERLRLHLPASERVRPGAALQFLAPERDRSAAAPEARADHEGLRSAGQARFRGAFAKAPIYPAPAVTPEAGKLGTSGAGGPLPYLETIQWAFGRHDVSGIVAHTDAQAAAASRAMGAAAFAMGNHVAFAREPNLYTAAHEAAHAIQQRAGVHPVGGVGEPGDLYERHADAVAARVVAGQPAEALLDEHAGAATAPVPLVQRQKEGNEPASEGPTWDEIAAVWEVVSIAIPGAELISPKAWAWILGVLAGDFNENPTTSQTIVRTALTMIPYVDQVGDAEDLAAALYKLIWEERYDEAGPWIDLALTGIGLIPEAGSLTKGILKTVVGKGKLLASVPRAKWILAKLREWGQGAAVGLQMLLSGLTVGVKSMRLAVEAVAAVARDTAKKLVTMLDKLLVGIGKVLGQLKERVAAAVEEIRKKLDEVVAGMKKGSGDTPDGPKGTEGSKSATQHDGDLPTVSKEQPKTKPKARTITKLTEPPYYKIPNQGLISRIDDAPPVDAGRQGKHVIDHNSNTSHPQQKGKSTFAKGTDHVYWTQKAWLDGSTVPNQLGSKSFDTGEVIGSNGETWIKVSMDGNGAIHGHPFGGPAAVKLPKRD